MSLTSDSRTMLTAVIVTAGILVAASLGLIAVAGIQFQNQAGTIVPYAVLNPVRIAIGTIAVVLTIVGFVGMRRMPKQGRWLVVSGSASVGILLYWAIYPAVLAILVATYGVIRANRISRDIASS